MKLEWGQEVGERWITFNGWLQDNYGLEQLNQLNKKEKISVIKQYLSDQGLADILISKWDQNQTIVKFKTNFTGKYLNKSTCYGYYQRGRTKSRPLTTLEAYLWPEKETRSGQQLLQLSNGSPNFLQVRQML